MARITQGEVHYIELVIIAMTTYRILLQEMKGVYRNLKSVKQILIGLS